MEVVTFADAQSCLDRCQPWLEAREAENSLMLGFLLRMAQRSLTPAWLGCVLDAGVPQVVALLSRGEVLLSDSLTSMAALDELAAALIAGGCAVEGWIGPRAAGVRLGELWQAATGCAASEQMPELLYRLDTVALPEPLPSGTLRLAHTAETELLVDWVCAFEAEALGQSNPDEVRTMVDLRLRNGDLFVWEVDGVAVALAGVTRPTRHGICINSVYTPPAWRRRGYASALVAQLSQRQLDSGYQFCTLFTNERNATSNAIYTAIGYRRIAVWSKYRLAA